MRDEAPTVPYGDGNPIVDGAARAETELRAKLHGLPLQQRMLELRNWSKAMRRVVNDIQDVSVDDDHMEDRDVSRVSSIWEDVDAPEKQGSGMHTPMIPTVQRQMPTDRDGWSSWSAGFKGDWIPEGQYAAGFRIATTRPHGRTRVGRQEDYVWCPTCASSVQHSTKCPFNATGYGGHHIVDQQAAPMSQRRSLSCRTVLWMPHPQFCVGRASHRRVIGSMTVLKSSWRSRTASRWRSTGCNSPQRVSPPTKMDIAASTPQDGTRPEPSWFALQGQVQQLLQATEQQSEEEIWREVCRQGCAEVVEASASSGHQTWRRNPHQALEMASQWMLHPPWQRNPLHSLDQMSQWTFQSGLHSPGLPQSPWPRPWPPPLPPLGNSPRGRGNFWQKETPPPWHQWLMLVDRLQRKGSREHRGQALLSHAPGKTCCGQSRTWHLRLLIPRASGSDRGIRPCSSSEPRQSLTQPCRAASCVSSSSASSSVRGTRVWGTVTWASSWYTSLNGPPFPTGTRYELESTWVVNPSAKVYHPGTTQTGTKPVSDDLSDPESTDLSEPSTDLSEPESSEEE